MDRKRGSQDILTQERIRLEIETRKSIGEQLSDKREKENGRRGDDREDVDGGRIRERKTRWKELDIP